jgi:hypothetical protein
VVRAHNGPLLFSGIELSVARVSTDFHDGTPLSVNSILCGFTLTALHVKHLHVLIFLLMYQVCPQSTQVAFSPVPLVETGADSDDSSCGHAPTATKSKLVRFTFA